MAKIYNNLKAFVGAFVYVAVVAVNFAVISTKQLSALRTTDQSKRWAVGIQQRKALSHVRARSFMGVCVCMSVSAGGKERQSCWTDVASMSTLTAALEFLFFKFQHSLYLAGFFLFYFFYFCILNVWCCIYLCRFVWCCCSFMWLNVETSSRIT